MNAIVSQLPLWGDDSQKYCPQCQQYLSLDDFHQNTRSKDGLNRICKPCNKAHTANYSRRKAVENKDRDPFDGSRQKYCHQCKSFLLVTQEHWSRNASNKDGLTSCCNSCNRTRANQYRADHLELVRSKDKARRPSKRPQSTKQEKYCSGCQQMKPRTEEFFHKNTTSKDGLCSRCKTCNSKKASQYKAEKRKANPPRLPATHCSKGHPLIEGNLRKDRRECLTCQKENARLRSQRKRTGTPLPRREGYCAQGHPLVEGNLRVTKRGEKRCLTCHRESAKRRYHKNPEKMVAYASAYAKSHREQINQRFRRYRELDWWKTRQKASSLRHRARRAGLDKIVFQEPRPYEDEQSAIHLEALLHDPCCYCGAPMESIDHIVPLVKSGPEHWTNLTAACKRCNSRKRDKSLLEFLIYRQMYPDPKQE